MQGKQKDCSCVRSRGQLEIKAITRGASDFARQVVVLGKVSDLRDPDLRNSGCDRLSLDLDFYGEGAIVTTDWV